MDRTFVRLLPIHLAFGMVLQAVAQVSVAIHPISATIDGGSTKQYQAIVNGTTNTGVKWYVDGILNGNETIGTIYSNGLYTAPNASANHVITVRSNADPTKFAESALKINSIVDVVVEPQQSLCVTYNTFLQFSAKVSGTTNQNVAWQVNGVSGGHSSVGRISANGLYTAPTVSGTFSVRAVSQANPEKTHSVPVTVQSAPGLWLSPANYTVPVSQKQRIRANLCGGNGDTMQWAVDNIVGGNATVGTIDSAGVYSAPHVPGTHTIRAASTFDSNKLVIGTVNVISGVTVDFGGRANNTKRILSAMFNAQFTYPISLASLQTIRAAGVTGVRMYSWIQDVYRTPTPDWSKLESNVTLAKNAGLRPFLEIAYTPPWLVPQISGCTPSYRMPPSDVNKYAQLAASIVTRMEEKFPGLIKDYEIWNEPDLSPFCVANNTDANRRTKYLELYAAVAPAMKKAAAAKGVSIRIGGPATVASSHAAWVSALVTDSRTAPYVDFVSYHDYPSGQDEAKAGMTWDDLKAGPQTLYDKVQGINAMGAAGYFKAVATKVFSGSQPGAAKTPVYLDEYNDGWWFGPNCCRNSWTYSPLFNTLYIAGMLNSVYQGSPNTPGKIYYYSANAFPYFCLVGAVNTNMDCATYAMQPYPQLNALKLLAGDSYLGLSAGGYMAKSVTPLTTPAAGLMATSFYTNSKNAIVMINPTNLAYTQVLVSANNIGFGSAKGTLYVLDSFNRGITNSPLSLTLSGSTYSARVDIPPYSVVAIGITP
jgi:hypothetical protein